MLNNVRLKVEEESEMLLELLINGQDFNSTRKLISKGHTMRGDAVAISCDGVAQAIEITELKQRVRRLEKKRQLKTSSLKRLRKVRTTQRVESSANTVMDDQEDASKQGGIVELDANKDVTLEAVDVEVAMDADAELAKVEEVIEVVIIAKLMTEVVTTAATTITSAQVPKASAPRRKKGVIIQDPEEATTASVIVHSKLCNLYCLSNLILFQIGNLLGQGDGSGVRAGVGEGRLGSAETSISSFSSSAAFSTS
nr:hypothetical protein [Tanacetum cinerariifolium]